MIEVMAVVAMLASAPGPSLVMIGPFDSLGQCERSKSLTEETIFENWPETTILAISCGENMDG